MRHSFLASLAIILPATPLAGQAPAAAAAVPAVPVGIYDFVADNPDGARHQGRLVIQDSSGQYRGWITPDGDSPAPITSVKTEGTNLVIQASPGAVAVTLTMAVRGDSLDGTYFVTRGMEQVESGTFRAGLVRR